MLWSPDAWKSYLERTKNQAKCMHVFDWSSVVHMGILWCDSSVFPLDQS